MNCNNFFAHRGTAEAAEQSNMGGLYPMKQVSLTEIFQDNSQLKK